jgi:protein-S-isoprenylcysteine O-methyltransferase Ste14
MIKTTDEVSQKTGSFPEPKTGALLKQRLARIGRPLFSRRLEIGLGVVAVTVPFIRPTIATTPSELRLKAGGLCLVLAGLVVRVWAAGFAGRHTRSSKIEGSQLATAGPYAHVRNPIYLGSVILGIGMVILSGDRRLLFPCALTFLALYFGMIPAEEEFLSQKFQDQYEVYCRNVPRLIPRITGWPGAAKTQFDWGAGCGEWQLSLILAGIWGLIRIRAACIAHKSL